ncbi:MAG: PHP domain-containing protein [Candidatus Methanodesulfokora washburnensis]|jgi:predicted metal-dependent phosphoesterase TrpH|uniref:PHP domain-containing protein n=1 Tax=Candidatus Methanodesulfokora washburnensis TaxID=2478471 RepID=A0A429GVU9_9CREN|nr:PHP domain-containing protein [Candidatus Methanodesulfokores washburnensis]RSN78018.1 PHP domain-containing protein [Candidatus Methanodesulfokores washburnensis]
MYDLHIHTKFSKDSLSEPHKIIEIAKKKGLSGVAITDHNSMQGYISAREAARKLDIDLIPGEEIMTNRGEILAYLISEEVKPHRSPEETIEEIREQGGISAIAHPFRGKSIRLGSIVRLVDFIEVTNGRSSRQENEKALKLATEYGKKGIGGSDAHTLREVGQVITVGGLRPERIIARECPYRYLFIIYSSIVKLIRL